MPSLGFDGSDVRIGKHVELTVRDGDGEQAARRMAEAPLANPVIEEFSCASCLTERASVARQLTSRLRLPSIGRPRRLTPDEVAIKARPWPRLPWWLWLAVAVTTVVMVVSRPACSA